MGGDWTLLGAPGMVHWGHFGFDMDNLSVVRFSLTSPSTKFIKCLDTNK
jgi:hypothetical protein